MDKLYGHTHTISISEYIFANFSYVKTVDNVPHVDSLKFYFAYNEKIKQLEGPFTPKLINEFVAAEARYIKEIL